MFIDYNPFDRILKSPVLLLLQGFASADRSETGGTYVWWVRFRIFGRSFAPR